MKRKRNHIVINALVVFIIWVIAICFFDYIVNN